MSKELPRWALPAAIATCVLALGLVIWRALAGNSDSAPAGRDIAVRPGMYDMRAEMQKPRPPK